MSYILDALKKSQSDKDKGSVPNIASEHDYVPFEEESTSKVGLLIGLLILLLVVTLAMSLYWYIEKKNDDQASPPLTQQELSSQAQHSVPLATVPADKPQTTHLPQQPVTAIAKPKQGGLQVEKVPLAVSEPVVTKVVRKPARQAVQTQTSHQAGALVSDAHKVAEQPLSEGQVDMSTLPSIIYTTHIYATDKKDRFVMLNGKAFTIGDTVLPGLKIIDILEDDLLLSYRGKQFSLPSLTDINPPAQ